MMDDKRLQTEFDAYFKGAELPDNMTTDAKAHVKPRKREIRKWFLRLAPVAAAVVLIISLSVVFMNRFMPSNISDGNSGNMSGDANPHYSYYDIAELTRVPVDPYSANDIKGLEFAEKLAYMANSNINLTAFYESDNLILAKAEISLLHNRYRHDAVLYVEYTDENYCYEELTDFFNGENRKYGGYDYIYTQSFDEGEQVYMIYMYTGGVKYYLSVMTSEPDGFKIYFDLLKNN